MPTLDQVLPYFKARGFQQDGANLGPSGVNAIIDNQVANAATTVEQGVRVASQYMYDRGGFGSWELSFSGNYLLLEHTSIQSYFPQAINVANTIGEPPKFRLRTGVAWQYNGLTADLMLNHTSGYQNTLFNPAQAIASWTTEDFSFKANLPVQKNMFWRGLSLVLSTQNLADRRPPFLAVPSGDIAIGRFAVPFDGTNASAIGRYMSIQIHKEW